MKSPSFSPRVLSALLLLQTGVVIGLVLDSVRTVAPAHAQIVPDPAQQQMQTNELLRGMDAKLGRISELLSSGDLKVKAAVQAEPRR